ncbi:MAG TPA: DsbA family protein [Tessaracoccus flavescens]|uniref:DsbA family protein n=1 Tax=Tessaracoccus flavescens TaxID=399497 RepID=A0A921EP88_9ACTN|nr:DsbA family protein [Tessaracoccus flavescens]
MANNSSLSKRAALRQQQELDERNKRNKRILTAGIGLLAVIALVVVAIVVTQAISRRTTVTEAQQTPPNATENYGILINGKAPQEGVPHVVIWEDFQCPGCKARELQYGPIQEKLVDDGKITLEIRAAHFLDGQGVTGGDSHKAAMAAAAADAVGKFREYHAVVYQNSTEGRGAFPDNKLRDEFAKLAGIEGDDLKKFQELYQTRAFFDWTDNANTKFGVDQIPSTPTYLVSGQRLEFYDEATQAVLIEPTEESMMAAINEAFEAGGKKHD